MDMLSEFKDSFQQQKGRHCIAEKIKESYSAENSCGGILISHHGIAFVKSLQTGSEQDSVLSKHLQIIRSKQMGFDGNKT